jgi:hypothetical protein
MYVHVGHVQTNMHMYMYVLHHAVAQDTNVMPRRLLRDNTDAGVLKLTKSCSYMYLEISPNLKIRL